MRTTRWKTGPLFSLVMALSTLAAPAASAGLWIAAEPTAADEGQEIAIRLFEGEPFRGEERAYRPEREVNLQRLWKKGRGKLPAALFRPTEAGVQLVSYSSPATGEFCKALIVVGGAETDDPIRWSELGHRLELVPQSDPVVLLHRGGTLQVQVLFEREPLAGAGVSALPERAPVEGRLEGTTDEIGLVSFRLDRPGRWMIKVERRELSATLVLAVGGSPKSD